MEAESKNRQLETLSSSELLKLLKKLKVHAESESNEKIKA